MTRFDNIIIEDEVTRTATITSGTETIDLPERGWLSAVNLRAAVVAAWVDESPLNTWQTITKVELLVDGSTTVKSLTGRQIRALAWYHGMELPPLGYYNRGGTGDKTFWTFPLLLGMFPGDTEHMLHLDKYTNPQLKITWDAAQSSFDGVSCDITSSPTFRYGADALISRETPEKAPKGYVQSTQIDSWTTENSGVHRTEIPKDPNLLGLMLGGRYDSIDTPEFFDNIKLDFDNGKWVALNHGFQQLMAHQALWFPRVVETISYQSVSDGDTPDPMLGFVNGLAWLSQTSSLGWIYQAGNEYPLYDYTMLRSDDSAAHTTRADVNLRWFGRLPHQTMYFPMHAWVGGKWTTLDPKEFGRIDMYTTMGSGVGSNATERLIAEYVIPNKA